MSKKIFKNMDYGILICTIILLSIGLIALYSATQNSEYVEFKKQIIWICVSIPIMVIVIFIDYETIAKASPILYGIILLTLVVVLFMEPINGASSWFNIGNVGVQPSEFAKIIVIIFLAYYISKVQEKGKDQISRFARLLLALAIVGVPIGLIILQPDYGTALSFILSTVLILFTAGIKKRYIIIGIVLVVILIPVMYMFVLPEHAKSRIDVFLNPNLDPRGAGYNVIQSKLAIGSGEFFRNGFTKRKSNSIGIFIS